MLKKIRTGKVAIVGAGFVGSTAAYALLIDGIASEIALIDKHEEKAEGHALDLKHGLLFKPGCKINYGNNYKLCRDAEIVVICAGVHQKPGETRLDLVKKNSEIFKEIIPKIAKENKNCILLIISNPLDILTYLAIKYSKFSPSKVFGSGTILDTARFRYLLGEYFKVNPTSVHAFILGEHGDSSFPLWSTANIAGVNLRLFKKYNKNAMQKIFKKTKNAAYEVVAKKGATYYAIGLSIVKIIRAILLDQNEVLPLSCLLKNYHGITNVCLSVPVVLNRDGIREQIVMQFDKQERKNFYKSTNILKKIIKQVS